MVGECWSGRCHDSWGGSGSESLLARLRVGYWSWSGLLLQRFLLGFPYAAGPQQYHTNCGGVLEKVILYGCFQVWPRFFSYHPTCHGPRFLKLGLVGRVGRRVTWNLKRRKVVAGGSCGESKN